MPIYSYQCSNCQKKFELLIGVIANQAEPQCPACGSTNVKKLPTAFSLGNSSSSATEPNSCSSGTCSTGFCPTC